MVEKAECASGLASSQLALVAEESEAPLSSSMTATSWCPSRAARCRGV